MTTLNSAPKAKAVSYQRLATKLVLLGFVILGLVLGVWVGSVGFLAWSLATRASRWRQMAADPSRVDFSALARDVHDSRENLVFLQGELGPVLWLGARMGGDWATAEPLMEAAVECSAAGDESLQALLPALADVTPGSLSMSALPGLLDGLVTARPALQKAEAHLDRASATLDRIDGPLSPRFERWVSQAKKAVALAKQGLVAAQIAPDLLARDGSRTYLVLVQNSDELRPTGGFISDLGHVVISHGTVISQTFQDSYAVDDFSKYYPDPPKPLLDYMNSEQWVVRDGNWSPDFPTTARDVVRLYQISRPEKIDGVIGINQKAVQMLMPGLEPLTVEGMSEPVTAANVEQVFQEAWNPSQSGPGASKDMMPWILGRKEFVGATVHAAISKLMSGKANWTRLALGILEAMQQRQLTVFADGPEAEQLGALNWDGSVRSTDGDYLMIVDANIGFGKVNPLIQESAEYHVSLQPNGTGRAAVELSYTHKGTQAGVICTPAIPYDQTISYDKMMNRCYGDYLRLLVPSGSRLRAATAHPVPGQYLWSGKPADGKAETLPEEAGRAAFGQFFMLEYGKSLQTRFDYDLPSIVKEGEGNQEYSLIVQKQSGTDALPVKVVLTLPPGSRLISANPQPTSVSDNSLQFDMVLDADREIQVVYASGH